MIRLRDEWKFRGVASLLIRGILGFPTLGNWTIQVTELVTIIEERILEETLQLYSFGIEV